MGEYVCDLLSLFGEVDAAQEYTMQQLHLSVGEAVLWLDPVKRDVSRLPRAENTVRIDAADFTTLSVLSRCVFIGRLVQRGVIAARFNLRGRFSYWTVAFGPKWYIPDETDLMRMLRELDTIGDAGNETD